MSALRFFTDEDIYAAVAPIMRRAHFDAISAPEANRLGKTDDEQLQWATSQNRAIVTFNVAHFANLHSEWLARGRDHSGIIVSSQRPVGDLANRLLRLAHTLDADAMHNRLEFLSGWQ